MRNKPDVFGYIENLFLHIPIITIHLSTEPSHTKTNA